MKLKEKLRQEFECAIVAVFGDQADKEYKRDLVSDSDLIAIARKVRFYLDD